ncbi:hypothetical protein RNZ50_08755 [Paracoccaceae bacterium Fryx2]|nr:hypothetical protein [Paracoccaceae bacterium Fryx2]
MLVAERLGDRIDFELIWQRQRITPELQRLLFEWATKVNGIFDQVAPGLQISEVAKRPEIWSRVVAGRYPRPAADIPELAG